MPLFSSDKKLRVLDPGHLYELTNLDDDKTQILRFVKRNNPPEKYPGNSDAYPGTNLQEVLRALINRFQYLNNQAPCGHNDDCISLLRQALRLLEQRASEKHGLTYKPAVPGLPIEEQPTCPIDGHVTCVHKN